MFKYRFLLFFLTVTVFCVRGQTELSWRDFGDVTFKPVFNEFYDMHFLMPTFGTTIKSYDGSKVSITGYFLDLTGDGEVFLISSNPMSSCFFCGGAGPETIVEARFTSPPPFKTDQIVKATGILEINADDVNKCNYILHDATGELIQ